MNRCTHSVSRPLIFTLSLVHAVNVSSSRFLIGHVYPIRNGKKRPALPTPLKSIVIDYSYFYLHNFDFDFSVLDPHSSSSQTLFPQSLPTALLLTSPPRAQSTHHPTEPQRLRLGSYVSSRPYSCSSRLYGDYAAYDDAVLGCAASDYAVAAGQGSFAVEGRAERGTGAAGCVAVVGRRVVSEGSSSAGWDGSAARVRGVAVAGVEGRESVAVVVVCYRTVAEGGARLMVEVSWRARWWSKGVVVAEGRCVNRCSILGLPSWL